MIHCKFSHSHAYVLINKGNYDIHKCEITYYQQLMVYEVTKSIN